MNCLFLVLLLLCCGNGNESGNGNCCGSNSGRRREERRDRCDSDGGFGRRDGNNGRCERPDNDDCGCRNDFRPEPRFEQRPFMFNQSSDCGCDNPQNNDCN